MKLVYSENISRRLILGGMGGGLLSPLLSACGKQHGAADELRAATVGKGDSDNALLLQKAGLTPTDYKVGYSRFSSGQLVIEAFNAGSLDFGGFSEIPPAFAAASTMQTFRQIAVTHGDVNNQVILLPRGSKVEDLRGLKGKRIGYVRATTSQYFLVRMLESVGLNWGDIKPVAVNVSDGAAAFSAGSLDAWAIYGFPIQRAIATEGARILKTAYGFLSGNYIVAASVDALADPARSALIGKHLERVKRGYEWAAAHQSQWAEVVAGEIGVPLAYVQDQFRRKSAVYTLRSVTEEAILSQQKVADLFTEQKMIPRRVDVRTLWDNRFNAILEQS